MVLFTIHYTPIITIITAIITAITSMPLKQNKKTQKYILKLDGMNEGSPDGVVYGNDPIWRHSRSRPFLSFYLFIFLIFFLSFCFVFEFLAVCASFALVIRFALFPVSHRSQPLNFFVTP